MRLDNRQRCRLVWPRVPGQPIEEIVSNGEKLATRGITRRRFVRDGAVGTVALGAATNPILARAIGAEPASIRRVFASGHSNPTLGTLAEVASALGMQVTLTPLPATERRKVTQPLLQGRVADPKALAEHLVATRSGRSLAPAAR